MTDGELRADADDVTRLLQQRGARRGAAEATDMMLEAAIRYGSRGWRVFPVAGKVPRLAAWPTQATTDEPTITGWWRTWPTANIGIVTGADSDLAVLDVDGDAGAESLRELERQHGALPETVVNLTGRGDQHLLFRHPGGTVRNAVKMWPGIDVRGDGGYIVAPPSRTIGLYMWQLGHEPGAVPLAPIPAWLLERLRGGRTAGIARAPDEWAALIRGPIPAGSRNDSLARLAGYLFRRRPAPRVVLELVRAVNQARCLPPLSEDEIVRTVDSIARRELSRRQDGLG